jgi:type I restriction enzyme S subunit
VVCSERILRKYLYFLGDQISESIKAKTHGNTMQHITKGLFEEIEIPLPSVETQESIVEKLEKEESLIKSNSFLINEYESRKFELLNNLWNG